LLGRYGMRRYNEAFSERNINFWTVGPHVDWQCGPEDEAPRSSLLRRSSHFGYEGRKLRGILRNSPKPLPSFAKATGYSAKENNKNPKPFVWTRPVNDRLKKIPHGNAVIETPP